MAGERVDQTGEMEKTGPNRAAETSVALPRSLADNRRYEAGNVLNLTRLGRRDLVVMPHEAYSVKDGSMKSQNGVRRRAAAVLSGLALTGILLCGATALAEPTAETPTVESPIRESKQGAAAALMPASVNAMLEIRDPGQVAALVPLAFVGPEGQQLAHSLRLLSGAKVSLGIDTQTEQALLVIDVGDAQRLRPLAEEAIRILAELANGLQAAPNHANEAPAAPPDAESEAVEPGTILRRFGRLTVARLDRRLLVATEPAWIEGALAAQDAASQSPDDAAKPAPEVEEPREPFASLADDPTFRAAAAAIDAGAPAWLFVRPSALAKLLTGDGLLMRAGEQFPMFKEALGGLLLPASRAPYLALELGERDGQMEISLVLPEEMRDADGDLRLLVAALDNDAQAFAPLLPKDTILSISAAVSHDAVALARKLLLNPERLEKLSETSPDAAALLQGLPLIEKLLAEVQPQMQFVIVKQPAATSQRAQADMRLPAAAIVFHPRHPQEVKTAFITTYLGAIRNANVKAKATGMPTYTLHSERRGAALVTGAVRREMSDDPQPGRLAYNLSPAMAVIGDRYLISTNLELAQELADLAQTTPATLEASNLRVDVGSAAVLGVLAENLPALMQGRQPTSGDPATPLVDLAADALRRFKNRLPAEPLEAGGATRIPWRVRMRARFGRL